MALPDPERGLVISYAYLWRHESERGIEEGRKDRPCAIVLSVSRGEAFPTVTVAPITHAPPSDPGVAIEIPAPVKRHLGLDDARSWIILDEFNEFGWPGFDLRPVPGRPGQYGYGLLPPGFFTQVVERFRELSGTARQRTIRRDAN